MSKELETLEEIKYKLSELEFVLKHNHQESAPYIQETKWNIIERALKEYELMKNTCFIVADKKISDEDLEKLKNQRMFASVSEGSKVELLFDEETQKKLKALEIIREKEVDIFSIKYTSDFEKYNYRMSKTGFAYAHRLLTKEKFDLLKEVLL